jgi:hypothetical protein
MDGMCQASRYQIVQILLFELEDYNPLVLWNFPKDKARSLCSQGCPKWGESHVIHLIPDNFQSALSARRIVYSLSNGESMTASIPHLPDFAPDFLWCFILARWQDCSLNDH